MDMRARILLILTLFIGLSAFSQTEVTVKDEPKAYQIEKIFPNPINDFIYVDINAIDYADATFILLDILGNTVQQWEPKQIFPGDQQIKLSLKNLHSGIYLLKIKTGNCIQVYKLRKN